MIPLQGFKDLVKRPVIAETFELYGEFLHLDAPPVRRILARTAIDTQLSRYDAVTLLCLHLGSRDDAERAPYWGTGRREAGPVAMALERFAADRGIRPESATRRYEAVVSKWRRARMAGVLWKFWSRAPADWLAIYELEKVIDAMRRGAV